MTRKVVVVGGGIEQVQAALDLADSGLQVTLVASSPAFKETSLCLTPKLLRAAHHPNIRVITDAAVVQAKGEGENLSIRLEQHPRYVDSALCTSCGRCERECPVEIKKPSGESLGKAIHRPEGGLKAVPPAYSIEKRGTPPCNAACPAGVNAQGYIALLAGGKFSQAHELIMDNIPFARVLGRVCTHPCEKQCARGKIDQPVSICALKRFAADKNGHTREAADYNVKALWASRVGIIGAGPAGLSAAWQLARLGHKSTVFEALPLPGGMITVGMPRFRLPREVRQADIRDISRLGIEIRTSTLIGKDLMLDDVKRLGYDAILIATGAHRNQKLGIPGEYLSGVLNSITFLRALNLKQPIKVGRKVVVVGGGYTAIDSARTAVRLQCEKVTILYRRSLEEMPANPEEVAEAREEGVNIKYLVAPVRILGQDDKVVGVECLRMTLGEPDRSGRRRPVPVEGSEFVIEADTVIVAVGQRPDLSFLKDEGILAEGKRHISVDPLTMMTHIPGIFAAGDVAAEPGPMVNAVAAGRRAAMAIDKYLRGETTTAGPQKKVIPVDISPDEVFVPPIQRQVMPAREYEDRLGNFEEVDLGFSPEAAVLEAQRCLNCGICSQCQECVHACELKAIDHKAAGNSLELMAGAVIAGPGELPALANDPRLYRLESPAKGDLTAASAAAARVMIDLARRSLDRTEVHPASRMPAPADPKSGTPPRTGVFVCGCGGNISDRLNVPVLLSGLKDVSFSDGIDYACTPEAASRIKEIAAAERLSHVVLAACACCNLDQICYSCGDRRIRCKTNLLNDSNDVYYEFVNIREHCTWVHPGSDANGKALALIKAGLARARLSRLTRQAILDTEQKVLVAGGGKAGRQAAAGLAAMGIHTVLMSAGTPPELKALQKERNITLLTGAALFSLESAAKGYHAVITYDGKNSPLTFGAIVVDPGEGMELPPLLQKTLDGLNNSSEPVLTRLPGVFRASGDEAQALAAVAKAAAWLSRPVEVNPTLAYADPARCRGCGTCVTTCRFDAVELRRERGGGIQVAVVDERLCQGCGACVATCPSGAMGQAGAADDQILAMLEAILS